MKHVGQPAGDDADHAGVPALARQHDRPAVAQAAFRLDHRPRFVQDQTLYLLAAKVAGIELGRDRSRLLVVVGR